jgi:microcystin-dependent protein
MDEFMGVIKLFAGNFAPQGWAFCDGSSIAINANTALFSLLGTQYGGNGTTNFALPDLRGRVVTGSGSGPGLSPRQNGQRGGAETAAAAVTGTAKVAAPADSSTPISVPLTGNVPVMPPFVAINYIICVQGIYPPRS